jgi:hypothetical protein
VCPSSMNNPYVSWHETDGVRTYDIVQVDDPRYSRDTTNARYS